MVNGFLHRIISIQQAIPSRLRPHLTSLARPLFLRSILQPLPNMESSTSSSSSTKSSSQAAFTTSSTSSTASSGGPIQQMISQRIQDSLNPIHFEIENESYKHSVPKGSESHFKLFIVSAQFENITLIDRHRLVNNIVKGNDTNLPVHALSISAKTPAQWAAGAKIQDTPNCKGGSKHDTPKEE